MTDRDQFAEKQSQKQKRSSRGENEFKKKRTASRGVSLTEKELRELQDFERKRSTTGAVFRENSRTRNIIRDMKSDDARKDRENVGNKENVNFQNMEDCPSQDLTACKSQLSSMIDHSYHLKTMTKDDRTVHTPQPEKAKEGDQISKLQLEIEALKQEKVEREREFLRTKSEMDSIKGTLKLNQEFLINLKKDMSQYQNSAATSVMSMASSNKLNFLGSLNTYSNPEKSSEVRRKIVYN